MSLLWIIVINQVKIKKKFLIFTTQKNVIPKEERNDRSMRNLTNQSIRFLLVATSSK